MEKEPQENTFDMLAAIANTVTINEFFECWGDIGYKLLKAILPNSTEKPKQKITLNT